METMTMASYSVGFTLPGMIEERGSLAGRTDSPWPQRGPDAPTSECRWRSGAASTQPT
jgi:hypothetical protein